MAIGIGIGIAIGMGTDNLPVWIAAGWQLDQHWAQAFNSESSVKKMLRMGIEILRSILIWEK